MFIPALLGECFSVDLVGIDSVHVGVDVGGTVVIESLSHVLFLCKFIETIEADCLSPLILNFPGRSHNWYLTRLLAGVNKLTAEWPGSCF